MVNLSESHDTKNVFRKTEEVRTVRRGTIGFNPENKNDRIFDNKPQAQKAANSLITAFLKECGYPQMQFDYFASRAASSFVLPKGINLIQNQEKTFSISGSNLYPNMEIIISNPYLDDETKEITGYCFTIKDRTKIGLSLFISYRYDKTERNGQAKGSFDVVIQAPEGGSGIKRKNTHHFAHR